MLISICKLTLWKVFRPEHPPGPGKLSSALDPVAEPAE